MGEVTFSEFLRTYKSASATTYIDDASKVIKVPKDSQLPQAEK
jgi:hypothetical protein